MYFRKFCAIIRKKKEKLANSRRLLLCRDKTGKLLEQPQRSARGVKPPNNEAHIDHIIPKSSGGANSFSNAQVIERSANIAKSNNLFFGESQYFQYSVPDLPNFGGMVSSTITGTSSAGIGILEATQGD